MQLYGPRGIKPNSNEQPGNPLSDEGHLSHFVAGGIELKG